VRYPSGHELPPDQETAHDKAVRLEVISAVYWTSAIILLYFTLGQSQAMKAAWVEDILGLFPPIAFLIASRFRHRAPDRRFAWGYHRAITVAYAVSTVALFALGLFLLIDSTEKLLKGTHPPIGMVEIFDTQVWLGWLMMGALLYSGIPPIILGRLKRPLADALHDKVLFADAKMNIADWLTASAALVGVIGIGFGLWWADSVAAIAISIDILHDGTRYLRQSVADLMDDSPQTYDEAAPHPLIAEVRKEVGSTPWVKEAAIRLREEGHMLTGEVLVVPKNSQQLLARVEDLGQRLRELDWQMKDIVVAPVRSIDRAPAGLLVKPAKRSGGGRGKRS
jgi:cation diffusion facilitator family transporter